MTSNHISYQLFYCSLFFSTFLRNKYPDCQCLLLYIPIVMKPHPRSIPFSFDEKLVIRTPLLPCTGKIDSVSNFLPQYQSLIDEALYLASPSFYYELQKSRMEATLSDKEGNRLSMTLHKYLSRMSSRSTPFGLFAGCTVGTWAAQHDFVLKNSIQRNTQLDMEYYYRLVSDLIKLPEIRHCVKFYRNSSLYRVGDEYRLVSYHYVQGRRSHHITAVAQSDYLVKLLDAAETGIYYSELLAVIDDDTITTVEKQAFVDDAISSQLLVDSLEPPITGKNSVEYLLDVLGTLTGSTANVYRALLQRSKEALRTMDSTSVNSVTDYQRVLALHRNIEASVDENRFFQVTMLRPTHQDHIDRSLQPLISEALEVLNYLTPPLENSFIDHFKATFTKQYGEQEIPLAEVLDPDVGIGYGNKKRNTTTLTKGLRVSPPANQIRSLTIKLTKVQQLLSHILVSASQEGAYEVDIAEHLPLDTSTLRWHDLPDALACLFQIVAPSRIAVNVFTGNSAARIVGRFAQHHPEINTICQTITNHERAAEPDKIIAEVVHLPDSRDGNIIRHPAFHDYEIPYLGQSSVAPDHQISINDLLVSVRNDQVILRSKKHDKEVRPRLTNTHNFVSNSQPIYRFLCDLQYQHNRYSLQFHWGSTASLYPFLPRACYGKSIILSPAQWTLSAKDTRCITKKNLDKSDAIGSFRERWKLPQWVTLAEGDNELLIDFDNPVSVKTFVDTAKKRETILLREFLYQPDQAIVRDTKNHPYTHECLATLFKQRTPFKSVVVPRISLDSCITRDFPVGTEWLYFKVYCGEETANTILIQAIAPLVQQLKEENRIVKWFFIRYNDPDAHLRVRFLLCDPSDVGYVIQAIHHQLQYYLQHRFIKNLQLETYQRELERYGSQTIELSEDVFWADSEAVLAMLTYTKQHPHSDHTPWLWVIQAIDGLLESMNFTISEKLAIMNPLKKSFSYEFKAGKTTKQHINTIYRNYKRDIANVLTASTHVDEPMCKLLTTKHLKIKDALRQFRLLAERNALDVPLAGILQSHIHMHVNRAFADEQRLHELVLYDMLCQYYITQTHLQASLQTTVVGR